MIMKIVFPNDLSFKGNRDYLHGTDIVTSLQKIINNQVDDLSFLDIKFHGVSRHQLTFLEDAGSEIDPSAKVTGLARIGETNFRFKLLETSIPVIKRYLYDEKFIKQHLSWMEESVQKIILKSNKDFSPIEGWIAANKVLLQGLFPGVEGKWYFTRLEDYCFALESNLDQDVTLDFIKNFNFRLTKTDVFQNGNRLASIYFTLVKEAL
jgi:hypothetical protein